MSRGHDPFSTALASVREGLERGVFAAGQPIVIVEEARRLRLSVTPVREALAWLCGEGLVERAPTGGYLAPRLEPAAVRDRYGLRAICLTAALDLVTGSRNGRRALGPSGAGDLVARFSWLVRAAGNLALADAYFRVQGQLARLGSVEAQVFLDAAVEADQLLSLFEAGDLDPLRRGLAAYHDRRMTAASILLAAIDRMAPPDLAQGEPA